MQTSSNRLTDFIPANHSGEPTASPVTREQVRTAESIREIIAHVAHWLPSQGPIKDFVHHNTLHAYQHRSFHDAVRVAARMYGAKPYLDLREYRALYAQGKIHTAAIDDAIRRCGLTAVEAAEFRQRMFDVPEAPGREQIGIANEGLRARWMSRYGFSMSAQVHPTLFRVIASYLDQGISVWRMPHADDSLFSAVRRLVEESYLPYPPFSHPEARRLLSLSPEMAILEVLTAFCSTPEQDARYLTETALAHPGWSGMVHMIETQPGALTLRRRASLVEFLALELIAERAVVLERGLTAPNLISDPDEAALVIPAEAAAPAFTAREELQACWHEAFERTYTESLVTSLTASPRVTATEIGTASVQAFFCIDDRECSIRRHLEEIDPTIETFGTAGFFGVDCMFQGSTDAFPMKHCPVPVSPKHLIREIPRAGESRRSPNRAFHLEGQSNTFFRGWLISQTLGGWAALKLAISLFRPTMDPATVSSLRRVDAEADLQVARESDGLSVDGYFIGYTEAEMAVRVGGLLRATGVVNRPFAHLVVFMGHGASSVNNPYFSAYDCGACSGKAGSPNARAFAKMANLPGVRALLKERGIEIPEVTRFVGGLHDTTRDEVQFFDLETLSSERRAELMDFRGRLKIALRRNAQERCRRFALVPLEVDEYAAHREVRRRSTAIFEPRPELNHATNAACLVGRREVSRGLFLDRRSFLNSYDPTIDPKGDILASILGAVVPVCGGINLEYFFSRVDSERYGAGSKLPHNVMGLIGVSNGTEGDLLTGLPTQMTEMHDPVRLTLVVEQSPEIALSALTRNPAVHEWIQNGWVRFFSLAPEGGVAFEYVAGKMEPFVAISAGSKVREVSTSTLAFRGTRENAPVSRILAKGKV